MHYGRIMVPRSWTLYWRSSATESLPSDLMFSVTAGDNSDIIFETNYDIIGCYIEDENFNLEALFLESPSTINEVVGIHEVYQQNMETEQTGNNSTVELDQEMQDLIAELDLQLSSRSSTLQCFPDNPRISENLRYVVFHEEEEENRIGSISWCTCTHWGSFTKGPIRVFPTCYANISDLRRSYLNCPGIVAYAIGLWRIGAGMRATEIGGRGRTKTRRIRKNRRI
ncbi:uncharacterized protein [Engystomops pustulosus]|uniref:uncharacterized protein isoform X3 n=1 Tax=Engystomops pustulosus TaxID=76066 RepID=UPI003AFA7882